MLIKCFLLNGYLMFQKWNLSLLKVIIYIMKQGLFFLSFLVLHHYFHVRCMRVSKWTITTLTSPSCYPHELVSLFSQHNTSWFSLMYVKALGANRPSVGPRISLCNTTITATNSTTLHRTPARSSKKYVVWYLVVGLLCYTRKDMQENSK